MKTLRCGKHKKDKDYVNLTSYKQTNKKTKNINHFKMGTLILVCYRLGFDNNFFFFLLLFDYTE